MTVLVLNDDAEILITLAFWSCDSSLSGWYGITFLREISSNFTVGVIFLSCSKTTNSSSSIFAYTDVFLLLFPTLTMYIPFIRTNRECSSQYDAQHLIGHSTVTSSLCPG